MPQYLFLAETIYKKMKNEKLFSKDVLENMGFVAQTYL